MRVYVGLEHWAYESYEGLPEVFTKEEDALQWLAGAPESEQHWREVYQVEVQ